MIDFIQRLMFLDHLLPACLGDQRCRGELCCMHVLAEPQGAAVGRPTS